MPEAEYIPRKRGPIERVAEAAAASKPGAWWYVNLAPAVDRPLLRLTGGRFSSVRLEPAGRE